MKDLLCIEEEFMKFAVKLLIMTIILVAGFASFATAATHESFQEKRDSYFDTFTVYLENDLFAGTDRDYTNGIKFSWSTPFGDIEKTSLPAWSFPFFKQLPFVGKPNSKHAVSLSLGQDMFTPEDTESVAVVKDDRPYAGYTYLAAGFHSRKDHRKDSWEIRLGVIGPASQAEETQNIVHDLIGADRAKGWDNQLENELAIDLICESQWRWWSASIGKSLGFNVIPHLGGRIGTVNVYLNTGAELRFGWNLPNDFGSCPIRGGCETNSAFYDHSVSGSTFHFFLSADGKAVVHDIFLDGNLFHDSHSVDKEPFVGELMGGVAWQQGVMKLVYSYIYRTRQFKIQDENQTFGSLSIALSF
ncbi:MAG: lipid A deacylase LpxR family protein [Desulfuromonadales bacterium]|nr:lipid A deacylase LpxR family protein [Desulfuromonadales bacterium]